MIKDIYKWEEIYDFAWELSQNDLYASYHRIKSEEQLKYELQKAEDSERERIIACYRDEVLCGVSVYHWIPEENYAQTTLFLIKGDYDSIADEIILYMAKELPLYELFIGIPVSNKRADEYFVNHNFQCIDALVDTRLYNLKSAPKGNLLHCIEEITEENFDTYTVFHDTYAVPLEIYYNSKNLKKELNIFRIFVYKEEGVIHGSIFTKASSRISEIFGMFIDEGYRNKGVENILIDASISELRAEFESVNEVAYFIDEDEMAELQAALAAGFKINDNYRCYKCVLNM